MRKNSTNSKRYIIALVAIYLSMFAVSCFACDCVHIINNKVNCNDTKNSVYKTTASHYIDIKNQVNGNSSRDNEDNNKNLGIKKSDERIQNQVAFNEPIIIDKVYNLVNTTVIKNITINKHLQQQQKCMLVKLLI